MRSVFGWSLPPGCSHRDIDRAFGSDGPCMVCGKSENDCICPECPVCQSYGDPMCYERHGLVRTPEQIVSFAASEAAWRQENAVMDQALWQGYLDDKLWGCILDGDLSNAISWASQS